MLIVSSHSYKYYEIYSYFYHYFYNESPHFAYIYIYPYITPTCFINHKPCLIYINTLYKLKIIIIFLFAFKKMRL